MVPVRYVIIGTGAVGGTIGGLLAADGHEVVLVARGRQLEAIRADGLEVWTHRGVHQVRPPVAAGPQELALRRDDVLVLAVKSQDTAAALADWADRPVDGGGTAAEDLVLVCAQNGVDNERAALRRFSRVLGMCVWLPSTYLEPGKVQAIGTPVAGVLPIGPAVTGSTTARSDARAIAADLTSAGFRAPVVEDVMAWKWAKLLSNLANAVEALCGTERDEAWRELAALAVEEGREVLAAAGVRPASPEEQDSGLAGFEMRAAPGRTRGGGSSWQSLQRGSGSIETDWLNGEIVLLGALHGVATPVNALLQRRARQALAAGRGAGTVPAADLLAALDAAS
ncbi:ketopantoate reductase family protein [Actinotalea sp.]|uniref:ketopantoate reductase family protein n=1 Tax=Actinotalea sp. TaxID=1872145 RepID=UPI00356585BD